MGIAEVNDGSGGKGNPGGAEKPGHAFPEAGPGMVLLAVALTGIVWPGAFPALDVGMDLAQVMPERLFREDRAERGHER
jgi:hypothetical protein